MTIDLNILVRTKQQELLEEIARDRLADQLPRSQTSVRHELASACVRLANWLDGAGDRLSESHYAQVTG